MELNSSGILWTEVHQEQTYTVEKKDLSGRNISLWY